MKNYKTGNHLFFKKLVITFLYGLQHVRNTSITANIAITIPTLLYYIILAERIMPRRICLYVFILIVIFKACDYYKF